MLVLHLGIKGAALATVFSQYASAIGICLYALFIINDILPKRNDMHWNKTLLKNICSLSVLTSLQQSIVAQNFGADKKDRIKQGIKSTAVTSSLFCLVISFMVFIFAKPLMCIFIQPSETDIIYEGIRYLRIEGTFYIGIGLLFLLYGYYRAINKPVMSVILTIISLGTRVLLAYLLSAIPAIGVVGIWAAVPIGWALADITGFIYMKLLNPTSYKHF